jgi:hypothetical protein
MSGMSYKLLPEEITIQERVISPPPKKNYKILGTFYK